MVLRKYLIINRNGSVRITANKPKLAASEIAVMLNIDVPNQLFDKPTLVADIKIDESIMGRDLISAEVINNAKQIISDTLGLNISVSIEEPEVIE